MSNEIDGIILTRELLTSWTGRDLTREQCQRLGDEIVNSAGYFADGVSTVWERIAGDYCRTDGCGNEVGEGDGYAGYCPSCADMIAYFEDSGDTVNWDDDEWTLTELRRKHKNLRIKMMDYTSNW